MSLRLGLDCTSLYHERTGIGTFTARLLERLAERPDVDVTAFAVTWRGRGQLPSLVPPGVHAVTRPMVARLFRTAWVRSDAPPIEWWTGTLDVVHGPNFVVPPTRGAAQVVSVHDFSPWRFPQLVNRDVAAYPALVERAIRRGAWVHADSHFVADEIVDHFSVDPDRVVVVPIGVSDLPEESRGSDAATGHRLAGAERYVLALGTVEPRKNFPALVRAFDRLAAEDDDVRLVLAGPQGHGAAELRAAVSAASYRERITRLGFVTDAERAALLRAATVLAYPSRYEGFGLPPLEAQAAGVPVVATDAGSLPEVLGDSALLVPAASLDADVEPLSDALLDLLTDRERRADLVALGKANVARFSWDRCAAGMVALYQAASEAV